MPAICPNPSCQTFYGIPFGRFCPRCGSFIVLPGPRDPNLAAFSVTSNNFWLGYEPSTTTQMHFTQTYSFGPGPAPTMQAGPSLLEPLPIPDYLLQPTFNVEEEDLKMPAPFANHLLQPIAPVPSNERLFPDLADLGTPMAQPSNSSTLVAPSTPIQTLPIESLLAANEDGWSSPSLADEDGAPGSSTLDPTSLIESIHRKDKASRFGKKDREENTLFDELWCFKCSRSGHIEDSIQCQHSVKRAPVTDFDQGPSLARSS